MIVVSINTIKTRGRKKTSKSPDADSESKATRHRSRCPYNSSYNTDDESREYSKLKVVQPINDKFKLAVDYCTYLLEDKSQKCNDDVARKIQKWSKQHSIQMQS